MKGYFRQAGFGQGSFGDWSHGHRAEGLRGGRFGGGFRAHEGRRGEGRGFGHGGLKLVLLSLIAEKPSHGYELIKTIEERSKGIYAPSPGIVYPTLNWLEEGGFVTLSPDDDNRRTATITEAGQALLREKAGKLEMLLAGLQGGEDGRADIAPLFRAMDNLKAALKTRRLRPMDKPQLEAVVDWIDELARRIERS